MASARSQWLVALMGLASLLSPAQSRTISRRDTLDDIELPPMVPAKIKETDAPADPRGKLVKLRYGPYHLRPNSMYPSGPGDWRAAPPIGKPCKECFLGAFQGGIEYEDGTEANVDSGVYLHHFVVVNANKPDWLCGGMGLPNRQYIYNSGNERPPVRLNSKYDFGMRVDAQDQFTAMTEIINMSNKNKTVYTTVIYEVIPIDTPGYREATHLRMDVLLCGGSHVRAKKGAYTYQSAEYANPYSGVVLHNDGHGHSGTTDVTLFINDTVFCNSRQYYGLRRGWVQPREIARQHDRSANREEKFISDAAVCEDYGRVERGDRLKTVAYYNETEHSQMKTHQGHLDNQMGINFLYIGMDGENRPTAPLPPVGYIPQPRPQMGLGGGKWQGKGYPAGQLQSKGSPAGQLQSKGSPAGQL